MKISAAVAVFLFLALPLAANNPQSLTAVLSDTEVTIQGMDAGSQVVLLGVTLQVERNMLTRRAFSEVLTDEDGDGAVTFTPKGGVAFRSVWVAVDLNDGANVVAAPEDFELTNESISSADLQLGLDNLVTGLEHHHRNLDLLVVRPGDGAWMLRATDGSALDQDEVRNGQISIAFASAQPIDPDYAAAPATLSPADVIVALDPVRLEVRTLAVGN